MYTLHFGTKSEMIHTELLRKTITRIVFQLT